MGGLILVSLSKVFPLAKQPTCVKMVPRVSQPAVECTVYVVKDLLEQDVKPVSSPCQSINNFFCLIESGDELTVAGYLIIADRHSSNTLFNCNMC